MFISVHLLSMISQLIKWDQWLFSQINSHLTNPWLDMVLPYLRNSVFWTPLYLFLIVFFPMNFKKKGWWWVLVFICTVALTDMISSRLFKEYFERLRPCNDPALVGHMRLLLKNCSGGFSFTSSHAANHFGMAAFFYYSTRSFLKHWSFLAFAWAFVICYAQVYVGVHYPLDILGGALIGLGVGTLTALFFNKMFGFIIFGKEPTT